ncbi:PucR family transcriptional regulator [Streptomyces chartreusis]
MARATTLCSLLEGLGTTVLRPLSELPDRTRPVEGVAVHDPSGGGSIGRADLVLGIGIGDTAAACELLEVLSRREAAALLVGSAFTVDDLLRTTVRATGVAVLGMAETMSWTQLLPLLLRATRREGDPWLDDAWAPTSDLHVLANAMADLLDAPITIEDRSLRVLAFSDGQAAADSSRLETILEQRVPDWVLTELRERAVLGALFTEARPVYVEPLTPTELPRVAMAVRSGNELLGSVWAAVREPLSPEREKALIDSVRAVALLLLRARSRENFEQRARAELLRSILDRQNDSVGAAERLGLADRALRVLAARVTSTGTCVDSELDLQRLANAFAVHCTVTAHDSAVTVIGRTVYAAVPVDNESDPTAHQVARSFQSRAVATERLLIGIGRRVGSVTHASKSAADGDRILRVLCARGQRHGIADLSDVSLDVLLTRVADAAAEDGAEPGWQDNGPAAILLRHDREHGSDLAATLAAYLDMFGDIAKAARIVHVHTNTMRYRLRRLCELTGLDLNDPDTRLTTHLQLRLHALTKQPSH